MPLLSVIIPTLNAARTLDRCLKAVRAQDWPADQMEIVIADAGSTDATLEIARGHNVETIVPNPLKTGEAGKAAAIAASKGDIIALVDSDNIFDDTRYFSKTIAVFDDESVFCAEPLAWTFDPRDTLVNRYCALIGMNDPVSLFLGNYNRLSHLTGRFTGFPVTIVRENDNAYIVEIDPARVPTFGANGFMIRRAALDGLNWEPYYFDIDVFQQAVVRGRRRVGVIKTETRHLFCDSVRQFRRKQARRIRDYFHHAQKSERTYDYASVPKTKYLWFVLATVTVVPLLFQSLKGYLRKPDPAWWFHPAACWITLWEYGWGTVLSMFGAKEYDRSTWRQ